MTCVSIEHWWRGFDRWWCVFIVDGWWRLFATDSYALCFLWQLRFVFLMIAVICVSHDSCDLCFLWQLWFVCPMTAVICVSYDSCDLCFSWELCFVFLMTAGGVCFSPTVGDVCFSLATGDACLPAGVISYMRNRRRYHSRQRMQVSPCYLHSLSMNFHSVTELISHWLWQYDIVFYIK